MTEDDYVNIILEALAAKEGVTVEDLRAELDSFELDIDSITMFEALIDIEDKTGIRLPHDTETGKSLKSVRALARRLMEIAAGQARRPA